MRKLSLRCSGNDSEQLTGDASTAPRDEASCNSQNFGRSQGNVKCLRNGSGTIREDVQYGLVASLDSHDRCSGGQKNGVGNKVRST